jgi:CDP-glucose 4,6-dehydratase
VRALVTGAEGFLGANLCKELLARGHEVTAASLNRRNGTSLDALGVECRVEYGDVTDSAFVERVVSSSEADWVFHLAAVSIVRVAQANPALALKTNILGTINVLEACKRVGATALIASSDKAYGDHNGAEYVEGMALKPTGAYEVSKTCADHIGQLYGAIVVRCANLYGDGDLNWSRLIPNSIRLALSGKAPQIYGNAVHAKREWLYVKDAVDAYIKLAETNQAGAYNVGSGEQASPLEVANMICELLDCQRPEVVEKARDFYEIPEQKLNIGKIHALGWQHLYSLDEGVKRAVDWYSEYLR